MRDFSKVSPSLWHSERFNSLPSDDARDAYLYLLTSEHQTSAGCYRLPDAYAAADLRWPVERYQHARSELIASGLVNHDAALCRDDYALVPVQCPQNGNHLKGIRGVLERLPSQEIWAAATAELEAALEAMAKAKAEKDAKQEATAKAGNAWSNWKPKAA